MFITLFTSESSEFCPCHSTCLSLMTINKNDNCSCELNVLAQPSVVFPSLFRPKCSELNLQKKILFLLFVLKLLFGKWQPNWTNFNVNFEHFISTKEVLSLFMHLFVKGRVKKCVFGRSFRQICHRNVQLVSFCCSAKTVKHVSLLKAPHACNTGFTVFILCFTDAFVNSQEWTLSRTVPELKVVS